MEARSTGSHCGGHALGWMAPANLIATLGLVMCEMKPGQKAAATPMRTSAWKHGASFFATSLVAFSLVAFACFTSSFTQEVPLEGAGVMKMRRRGERSRRW